MHSKLVNYTLIQPPFGVDYKSWDEETARSNFDWFMGVISERIKILDKVVQENNPSVSFVANYKPETLKPLGHWLYENVTTRKRLSNEAEKLKSNVQGPLAKIANGIVQDWDLTDESMSLSYDVGLYLGEIFLRQHPGKLEWTLHRGALPTFLWVQF